MTSRRAPKSRPALAQCRRLKLKTISDARGHLTVVEAGREVPFPISRIFYVYGLRRGAERGGHAHRNFHELVVCLAGSIEVVVDDGRRQKTLVLKDPAHGVHVPPMLWVQVRTLSAGTVYLVLASARYAKSEYVRDYARFLELVGHRHAG